MGIRIEDLAKTDFRSVTVAGGRRIAPTSPGEMLREEFLKPWGLTTMTRASLGHACQKAREDQAVVGAPGGESIMSD